MDNQPEGSQSIAQEGAAQNAAPPRRGRPPTRVDQRIDQLTQIVGQLVNTFQNWAANNRGGDPADPVRENGANRRQETNTEGTGETGAPRPEASGTRTRTRGSMGSRQRRAQRRARERETGESNGQAGVDRDGLPPRPPPRAQAPIGSASVQNQGDLRDRIEARRAQPQATDGSLTASEAREIRERLGQLEEAMHVERRAVETHNHPFTREIMEVPLPDRFKSPTISLYEGKTDPDDHLDQFIGHMVLHGYPEEIMCRAFRNTLSGPARRWFAKLKQNSIASWEDLKRSFSNQFLGMKRFAAPKQNLTIMYQGPQESLRQWIARYSAEVVATEEITDNEALMGALSSMRHDIPFREDLNKKPPRTYQEFLERAQGFINAEEARTLALKSKVVVPRARPDDVDTSVDVGKKKKKRGSSGPFDGGYQDRGRRERNESSKRIRTDVEERKPFPPSRYDRYHNLTMSIEEVYHRISDRDYLRRPQPLKSNPAKRNQSR